MYHSVNCPASNQWNRTCADFVFQCPTRWRFGVGTIANLGDECRRLGSNVLLITGRRAMRELGVTQRVQVLLRDAGLSCALFDGISANPKTNEVDAAVACGRSIKAGVIIGLGGGSCLDAAKATAAALLAGQPASELLLQGISIDRSLPVIAVPTTAGTGSELSRGAILSDPLRRFKGGLRGDGLFPAVALVDPELSMTMSPILARLTGFDVLSHAIETYFSRKAHPATESLSLTAVELVRDYLLWPCPDSSERERAIQMAYASSLMGVNLANSTTCLPHRMQYAIGARTDTAHPAGLAALYPDWFSEVVAAEPKKSQRLLKVLFPEKASAERAFAHPAQAIEQVLASLGIRTTLQDLGLNSKADIRWCIDHVVGATDLDPSYEGPQTIEKIFLSAYARG